ncbi:hypothetical protein MAM1_0012c01272 [Mucor ambiguus]|uniref:C2H2-type domain-containing protein n=1 Tax=Mucor ambiguus TaxID=91626 RepID=A0A0C9MFI1_9FUNG|nr:hypothetical protein MAM1_0012c01272 [Mucor ambiguus]
MNPRDRTRRTLGNIKQEDCKSSATNAESSASIASDASTVDLTIKQEDTKDHKPFLEQQREFDERGYYYRCNICKRKMPNFKSVLGHRKSIHSIKQMNVTKINDTNMEPDINDPNFHCNPCGKGFQDVRKFRQHLRRVHYMVLKPMIRPKITQNGVIPDLDDPNLYCKSCNQTYKTETLPQAIC